MEKIDSNLEKRFPNSLSAMIMDVLDMKMENGETPTKEEIDLLITIVSQEYGRPLIEIVNEMLKERTVRITDGKNR